MILKLKKMKQNIRTFFVFACFFSFAIFCACKRKESETTGNLLGSQQKFTLLDYNNLKNLNWKGLLMITNGFWATQSYENGKDWHLGSAFIGTQAFKDVSQFPNAIVNDITVKIPDMRDGSSPITMEFDKNNPQGDNLFGKNVDINAFGMVGKFYVPQKIKLLSPKPDNVSIGSYKGTPVHANQGIDLRWNADVSNHRGVILEIYFFNNTGVPKYHTTNILEDNGSFKVTPEMLSVYTNDCYFELNLTRGNYHIADNKEDLIMSLSSVKAGYKLVP